MTAFQYSNQYESCSIMEFTVYCFDLSLHINPSIFKLKWGRQLAIV